MIRRLVLLLALLLATGAPAADRLGLAVVPDPGPLPMAGEMVLITIRGLYQGNVVRERLETPALDGFGWMQLGLDHWYNDVVGGRSVRVFERRMALFPERAGRLTIPSFTHNLEMMEGGGQRQWEAVRSAPVTVAATPGATGPDWWLPARAVRVRERWTGTPGALEPGESTEREVTLEVWGLGPERLPPMPSLRTADIFAFPSSEERSVVLTPDGPVASVTWRWSILPETPRPAVLPELRLPWFDTVARETRQIVLPARLIAVADAVAGKRATDDRPDGRGVLVPLAFLAGLVPGGVALWRRRGRASGRLRRGFEAAAAAIALARAAGRDPFRARTAARRLAGAQAADPRIARLLSGFDRAAYGPDGSGADAKKKAIVLVSELCGWHPLRRDKLN